MPSLQAMQRDAERRTTRGTPARSTLPTSIAHSLTDHGIALSGAIYRRFIGGCSVTWQEVIGVGPIVKALNRDGQWVLMVGGRLVADAHGVAVVFASAGEALRAA